MNNKHLLLLCCLFISLGAFAQQKEKMTREDKDEKNQARATRINDKNDYAIFHRQLLGLKEYMDERKKIPALMKTNKMPVKVIAGVDTTDVDMSDGKTLVGYIRQDIGDNSITTYDVVFDRAAKKISSVKRTAEAIEADNEVDTKPVNTSAVKTKEKIVIKKKSGDDDDDDADEDKPVKSKKAKDDDD